MLDTMLNDQHLFRLRTVFLSLIFILKNCRNVIEVIFSKLEEIVFGEICLQILAIQTQWTINIFGGLKIIN